MKKEKVRNFQLIINPDRNPIYAKQLTKIMKYITGCTIHESRDREHFKGLVRYFISSRDAYLLVWGGDGTANLALNTIMKYSDKTRRKHMAVGFLRGGSGNGTQDSYEVPYGLRAQIRTYLNSMEKDLTQRVDLLRIRFDNRTLYGQLFGTGLDARILNLRNGAAGIGSKDTTRRGLFPYLLPAARTILGGVGDSPDSQRILLRNGRFAFRGKRTNAEFPFSEYRVETTAPLIEAGVRPYYGWYYKICPDVVCNDGLMDAYLFNISGRGRIVFNIFNLWNGWYHRINDRNARKGKP